jgi:hypothetical protein
VVNTGRQGGSLRLYHFTGLRALIGDAAAAAIQPGVTDLATVAAPGSIIVDGLKPGREDGYDGVLRSPLPPCVWLTTDPDMGGIVLHFSSFADFRLTVLIPRTDQRLVHWLKYFRDHGRCTWLEAMPQVGITQAAQDTAETFYVYFGKITRFAEVTRTTKP